jgi:hypothetical protein
MLHDVTNLFRGTVSSFPTEQATRVETGHHQAFREQWLLNKMSRVFHQDLTFVHTLKKLPDNPPQPATGFN